MFNEIRNDVMADRGGPLMGSVEVDETLLGGKIRNDARRKRDALACATSCWRTLSRDRSLYTDEWGGYRTLASEDVHRTIRHRDRIYVDGLTHTQTVEGFFGSAKNAIRGVYHGVSVTWLHGYLNEYAWRYNHPGDRNTMFRDLLDAAASSRP